MMDCRTNNLLTKSRQGDMTRVAAIADHEDLPTTDGDCARRHAAPFKATGAVGNHRVVHGPTCKGKGRVNDLATAPKCPFCRLALSAHAAASQKCPACGGFILLLGGPEKPGLHIAVPAYYAHYRAARLAGQGGMGIVMYGINEATDTPVAIKLLPGCEHIGLKAIARFHREVAALRTIGHPNVVRLLSHGAIGCQRFLVMEWVEGPTFREIIDQGRRPRELPRFEVARDWLIQACAGLAAIHSAGVLHRDIKPSNLILENSIVVHIADFGIACLSRERLATSAANDARPDSELPTALVRSRTADALTGEFTSTSDDPAEAALPRAFVRPRSVDPHTASGEFTSSADDQPDSDLPGALLRSPLRERLTAEGEFAGTPDYMAPECLRSTLAASAQSDLYSLGVTFYEILTGERPLVSWPPPSALNHSLPESIDHIIMKLLAESPHERFSSALEVVAALGK